MASKIGVYFDASNIGGGLDVEALAAGVTAKWGTLAPVVKVFPVLADNVEAIKADITAEQLDGVLLCGASPRADAEIFRFPVLTEHVNLREQCVMCFQDKDGNPLKEGQAAPELLTMMATDYVNMGVVKMQKGNLPDSAALPEGGTQRILVVGGGFTGLTAALEAARSGYEVVLVEKTGELGGAAKNIPVGSPLSAPWDDKEPLKLDEKVAAVKAEKAITVYMNTTVAKLAGQPGAYECTLATPNGEKVEKIGSAVVACGWVPMDDKYLAPLGLGSSDKIVTAAAFQKMVAQGRVDAKRTAFVHLYFNVIGTILFLCGFYGLNALIGFAFFNDTANTFGIAIVHTIFNVVTTAILLPFNRLLEKLAILTVPDSPSDKKQENTLLDERLLTTPSVAVGRAMLTGSDMAEICRTALLQAMSTTRVWNDAIADEVLRKEDAVDHYEDVLGTYLVKLSAKHLSGEDNRTINTLLHTIGDFERVSDHAVNIIKTAEEIRTKNIKFSEEALNDLSVLEAAVQDIVNRTVDAFQKGDTYAAGKIEPLEQVVDGLVREVKTRHIARLQAGVCTIEYGFVLDDLLTNYERIADHCSNIAVAMIEVAADKFDTHEYLANVKHGGSVKFEQRYEKYRGRYTFPPEAYSEPAENQAEG